MVKNSKNLLIKLILLISIIALISAFFIEYILGHQPCNLCILERIPYFLAIIVILLNYKFIEFEKFFILFLTIIFLFGTVLSLYHLGIEQGLISCKDVTFKMFGLSLTSYNILISILITFSAGKIYFNYDKN